MPVDSLSKPTYSPGRKSQNHQPAVRPSIGTAIKVNMSDSERENNSFGGLTARLSRFILIQFNSDRKILASRRRWRDGARRCGSGARSHWSANTWPQASCWASSWDCSSSRDTSTSDNSERVPPESDDTLVDLRRSDPGADDGSRTRILSSGTSPGRSPVAAVDPIYRP